MTGSPLDATVTAALPGSLEGRAVLTAYFSDLVSRDHGRQATPDEVDSAMREDPSDDLCPPNGLLLVADRPVRRRAGVFTVTRTAADAEPAGQEEPTDADLPDHQPPPRGLHGLRRGVRRVERLAC
jgi:hypothetical protein